MRCTCSLRLPLLCLLTKKVNAHRGGSVRSTDVNRDAPPEQTLVHLSRVPGAVDGELVKNREREAEGEETGEEQRAESASTPW